jgi:uncharacterized protein (DUF1499 family)
MRTLALLAFLFIIVPLLLLAAGQFGLLTGRAPSDLGLKGGKLKPPSKTPNSVSSQAADWPEGEYASDYARIAPLAVRGDGAAAMARLRAVLAEWPRARLVEDRPDYLRVEFSTRWLRFTDDVEFWLDPAAGVIHVRSASRLGRKDFGVNRARIEAIRARLDTAGA